MKRNKRNPQGSPPHLPSPPLGVSVNPEINDLIVRLFQIKTDYYRIADKIAAQGETSIDVEVLSISSNIEDCVEDIGLLASFDFVSQIKTIHDKGKAKS